MSSKFRTTFLDGRVTMLLGDVRAMLKTLQPDHFDCVVTSPPYWGLRNYGTGKWEGGNPDCEHQRVFCSSLSDIFDNQVPRGWRVGLFRTIEGTPDLDWLLLTKRPENIGPMIDDCGWFKQIPRNVWLGTTCEDQSAYDRRWPILAQFNARVRFISYEPAIGPLTILNHKEKPDCFICGGESGKGYRSMPSLWAGNVMEECAEHFIPFFMKQMAGLKPIPEDLMVRQFPVGAAA